jgi:hypothetical protein
MRLDVPYRSFISGLIRPDWSEPKHQDHKRQKDFISSSSGTVELALCVRQGSG